MKISSSKKSKIMSADNGNLSDLKKQIKDALTDNICEEIVNLAYSEDGIFEKEIFTDSDTFWDIYSNEEPQDMVLKFFNGEDLDGRGQANPSRDYFRYDNYENVESTDYPGEIYLDQLDDEIVDYVMEHLDDREFPDDIQDIIDKYLADSEEE